jgi:hypothetical protein
MVTVLQEVILCSFVAQKFRTKLLSVPSVQKNDSPTLKDVTVDSSETLLPIYHITRRHIPEDYDQNLDTITCTVLAVVLEVDDLSRRSNMG